MDKKMLIRLLRRPVRLDAPVPVVPFDLDLLHRSFKVSLLVARMSRKPATYLRGGSEAAR
jgi:hypothetical protein